MQHSAHDIYVCHWATVSPAAIAGHFNDAACHDFSEAAQGAAVGTFERLSLALLERVHQALREGVRQLPLLQVVVSEQQFTLRSGIASLFRAITTEYPAFRGQVIAVNTHESAASLIDKLQCNAEVGDAQIEVLYRADQRFVLDWQEHEAHASVAMPWKAGEVYLISGGLGGLARLLIDEVQAQGHNNRVILVGRSGVDEPIRQQLEAWARGGVLVSYRRADVADPAQVDALVAWIIQTCGRLDGVIHCAGVIRDNLLLNKSAAEFKQVLQPKVQGALNLDQSTRHLPLGFFALFSSLSSVLGNVGQTDYATGNGFMDGYARLRAQRVREGEGSGRSVSINWPYWQGGGMRMDAAHVERMWQDSGLRALPTSRGMKAFYQALALDNEQLMVVGGNARRIRQVAASLRAAAPPAADFAVPAAPVAEAVAGDVAAAVLAHLTGLVAVELGLAEQRIKADALLSKYGIDSVMMIKIIARLESDFGSLPKTLFFEYQTLAELTGYLLAEHAPRVAQRWPGTAASVVQTVLPRESASQAIAVIPPPQPQSEPEPEPEQPTTDEPLIAIVAMAGRYPGADSVDAFWARLAEGYDAIDEIPAQRWDVEQVYAAQPTLGKSPCKWGGFIDAVASFDPAFFNVTPREATVIDPAARVLLQTVQHLFDSAGLTRQGIVERYQSRLGVFVGAMYQQYSAFESDLLSESLVSISSYSSIANRLSHFYDLRGPSVALDTMCSSSMVALHYARESLLRGECSGAVVAGVNLSLHPKKYIGLSASNLLGDTPHSRSFSDSGGYLPSEAVGAVLLRPLSDALRDQDEILGVIRSSHVCHSGGNRPYATPNVKAQAALIQENLDMAGIAAGSISYIEAAANGTVLSDAVEMLALRKVFGEPGVACAIGSVKSNIGHAEAASGMSQLTKVLLQLKHRQWLPTPAIARMNPDINWQQAPFALQSQLCDWPQPQWWLDGQQLTVPRRAAIDSFGAGGTYAHVIVEEYDCPSVNAPPLASASEHLIVLSANSKVSLLALAAAHLQQLDGAVQLEVYARALRHQRDPMPHRIAIVVPDIEVLKMRLHACAQQAERDADRVFVGCSETLDSDALQASGLGAQQRVLEEALQQGHLATLGALWVQGVEIDWQRLDGHGPWHPVKLPLYPFEQQACWLAPRISASVRAVETLENAEPAPGSPALQMVFAVLGEVTGLPASTWHAERALSDYNLGSATSMLFFQRLSQQAGELSLAELRDCETLYDVAALLGTRSLALAPAVVRAAPRARYPELVELNHGRSGRPVFWIHAGIGGVEAYQALAESVERPFYGIQARGYMSDRSPLQGLQAMATYYCHLVLMRQPVGPYSLGGYSLGGALAYEVTRQLQELGETVDSLVMVDSLDSRAMSGKAVSNRTLYLQSANIAIGAAFSGDLEQALGHMIHQDQIDSDVGDEEFLNQLAERTCRVISGVSVSLLTQRIRHNAQVQGAYDSDQFQIQPLPQPGAVDCHYLHNRSGDYFGPLQPYLFVHGDRSDLGKVDYSLGWAEQMPNMQVVEIDALCHMLMLTAQPALGQIIKHCQTLYTIADATVPIHCKGVVSVSIEA